MRFLPSRTLACLALSLLAVLATVPRSTAAQDAPKLAEHGSQRLVLAPGPNLVSLYIYPDDLSLDALFSSVQDSTFMVKGEDSRVYYPALGIRGVDRWTWTQSHVVYVGDSLSIDLSGRVIDPSTEIALDEGWQQVSFFGQEAVPVEQGIASIAASLSTIQDEDGRAYPTAGPAGLLSLLEPGRGYRIRLSRPDTLAWTPATAPSPTEEPPPSSGDVIRVRTLDEALALRGLKAGDVVEIAGYYAPGDGGGGTFDVLDSGAAPDGGTVFVPAEQQSAEVVDVLPYNATLVLPSVPAGEDVVFGSLSLLVEHTADGRAIQLPGHLLHGHRFTPKFALVPGITYDRGIFRQPGAPPIHRWLGEPRAGRLTFRYKHTTSSIRLHRRDVGSLLNAHWFGARPASQGAGWTGSTDVQPILAHMVNVATEMNRTAPQTITDLLLPALDTYDYFGSTDLTEGLTLRGAAGTEVVEVTNDLGHTYRPVRVRAAHTRLRLMDGEALMHIRMSKDPADPAYLTPDAKQVLDDRPTSFAPAGEAMRAGIEDLVLDGNWEGNRQAWDEGWASNEELENNLRNAPTWAGFISTRHGGKEIPQGQHLTVRNVAVLGFASNGLLGDANNTWTGENVLLGNSLWNHVLYNANGDYTNLTLTGFAWGHAAWGTGTVSNFVYEGGSVSPTRPGTSVFGIRGGDAYDPQELAGRDGYFTRSDGTVPSPFRTKIVGFYVDLRGSGLGIPFKGLGPSVMIRGASAEQPGRVVADPAAGFHSLHHESGNGYQKALYPNNRFEHIVLYDGTPGDAVTGGSTRESLFGYASLTESVVRDIRVERIGGQTGRAGQVMELRARRRNHPAWDTPQTVLYDQIMNGDARTKFIATVQASHDASGLDVFVRQSTFNNTSSTLFRGPDGMGRLSTFGGDATKLRVYMEDVSFNIPGNHLSNLELFFAMSRFRNSTDQRSGRTSEVSRTLRASDFSGGQAVVPLGLFWAPLNRDYVRFGGTGASAVASWEITDARGNALGDDQRDPHIRVRLAEPLGSRTITVDAAVRPWEDGIAIPTELIE